VHISLDDFGTGYSSLTLLKQLPVCELKIDQSFVSRIGESEADATIVGSIVELAHALDLTVVAEGVETIDVLERLEALGCDQAQGWLVGLPMNAETASAWIAQHQLDAARLVVPRQDARRRVAEATTTAAGTAAGSAARARIRP
jgi:EAL domain-containing protein (putative c-di-GMP-specific phosphodiesterase class I)